MNEKNQQEEGISQKVQVCFLRTWGCG